MEQQPQPQQQSEKLLQKYFNQIKNNNNDDFEKEPFTLNQVIDVIKKQNLDVEHNFICHKEVDERGVMNVTMFEKSGKILFKMHVFKSVFSNFEEEEKEITTSFYNDHDYVMDKNKNITYKYSCYWLKTQETGFIREYSNFSLEQLSSNFHAPFLVKEKIKSFLQQVLNKRFSKFYEFLFDDFEITFIPKKEMFDNTIFSELYVFCDDICIVNNCF